MIHRVEYCLTYFEVGPFSTAHLLLASRLFFSYRGETFEFQCNTNFVFFVRHDCHISLLLFVFSLSPYASACCISCWFMPCVCNPRRSCSSSRSSFTGKAKKLYDVKHFWRKISLKRFIPFLSYRNRLFDHVTVLQDFFISAGWPYLLMWGTADSHGYLNINKVLRRTYCQYENNMPEL